MTRRPRVLPKAFAKSGCVARENQQGLSSLGLQRRQQISARTSAGDPAREAQGTLPEQNVVARLGSALQTTVRACTGVLVLASWASAASAAPAQDPKLPDATFQARCVDCDPASRSAPADARVLAACDTTGKVPTSCTSGTTTPVASKNAATEIDHVLMKFLERRRAARAMP